MTDTRYMFGTLFLPNHYRGKMTFDWVEISAECLMAESKPVAVDYSRPSSGRTRFATFRTGASPCLPGMLLRTTLNCAGSRLVGRAAEDLREPAVVAQDLASNVQISCSQHKWCSGASLIKTHLLTESVHVLPSFPLLPEPQRPLGQPKK